MKGAICALVLAACLSVSVQAEDKDVLEVGGLNVRLNEEGSEPVMQISLGRGFREGHGGGGVGPGSGSGSHSSSHSDKKLLRRILPMFILPFLIQSAIVPMFLSTLKMMLVKSLLVGKLALILIAINALRNSNVFKSRSEERLADMHYGYHGSSMEEIGAYMSRWGR